MSRLNDGQLCARCGRPAQGVATIFLADEERRYCHGDERPSCYELTMREITFYPSPRFTP